jgi:cytochrome b561
VTAFGNTSRTYGWVSVTLHWLVAVLFLGEIPLGYLTQATAARPALQFALYQWHKSFGFLVLAVAVVRVGWSLMQPAPGHLGTTRLEIILAPVVRGLLLAMTVAVPLAGWCIASSSPLDIPSLAFNTVLIPNLPLPVSDAWELRFSWLHAVLAYSAGVLACLHIAAALRHHLVLKDRTLWRMLIPG